MTKSIIDGTEPNFGSPEKIPGFTAYFNKVLDSKNGINIAYYGRHGEASGKPEQLDVFLAVEADVIISAVIVGFTCSRFYQGQPCQFDFEGPGDTESAKFFADREKLYAEQRQLTEQKQRVINAFNEPDCTISYDERSANLQAIDTRIQEIDKQIKELGTGKDEAKYLKEYQFFENVLDALSYVIEKQEPGMR